jgi:hypothetical protein
MWRGINKISGKKISLFMLNIFIDIKIITSVGRPDKMV